jgi:hypothetical protein
MPRPNKSRATPQRAKRRLPMALRTAKRRYRRRKHPRLSPLPIWREPNLERITPLNSSVAHLGDPGRIAA